MFNDNNTNNIWYRREVFEESKATAKEFNTRGDLFAGANIVAFLKVANVMFAHGSV